MMFRYPQEIGPDDPIRKPTEEFYMKVLVGNASEAELIALVQQGICPEVRGDGDYTPLIWAICNYDTPLVQALLTAGAKLDTPNDQGMTPLHAAIGRGMIKIVEMLIAAGADIEARAKKFKTPLYAAALRNDRQFMDALLAAGAQIEARTTYGATPLLAAVWNSSEGTAEAFFTRGANIYACTHVDDHYKPAIEKDFVRKHPFIREGQALYKEFITSHKAPVSSRGAYQLLACTPLADPCAPVDYVGNLRRIFTHAQWNNKEQAANILTEMQGHGSIRAETVESILAATFPPERTRSTPRSQMKSVGVAI